jgi:UDP-3-O-[3-hydroxymyristoyl] N-acetylglucosamine deacetylase
MPLERSTAGSRAESGPSPADEAERAERRSDIRMTPSTSPSSRQTTLRRGVTLEGRGAHYNVAARLTISPAEAGAGIVFSRADAEPAIAAHWRNVRDNRLRVEIGQSDTRISTIEHLMASFVGMGVDNALVEVDGPEVPAMDGSARAFVAAIAEAGLRRLAAPRRAIEVLEPVRVVRGASWAELAPTGAPRLDLDVEIAFAGALGRQRARFALEPGVFAREIASARSFGFVEDAERLWREGLALGASLENSVVLDGDDVLNPEGLRCDNEMARHKLLDVLGDLALAGAPIHGAFRSYRGGHALNLALVEKLMTTRGACRIVDGGAQRTREKPAASAELGPSP